MSEEEARAVSWVLDLLDELRRLNQIAPGSPRAKEIEGVMDRLLAPSPPDLGVQAAEQGHPRDAAG